MMLVPHSRECVFVLAGRNMCLLFRKRARRPPRLNVIVLLGIVCTVSTRHRVVSCGTLKRPSYLVGWIVHVHQGVSIRE